MTDDPILDTVRTGLRAVQMNRPVDDIVQRGRARRRARAFTAGAGVALCATLTLVALSPSRGAPGAVGSPHPAVEPASPSIRPASFTLARSADGTYTFDVVPGVPLDTTAVERSLGEIGIDARVTIGQVCTGRHADLITTVDLLAGLVVHSDGTASIRLDSRDFPAKSTLSLGLVLNTEGRLIAARFGMYVAGGKWDCQTITSIEPTRSPSKPARS